MSRLVLFCYRVATMAQQRKRYSYNPSLKLKAFESAEKMSKEAAACQFKVDAHRIREWRRRVAASTALARYAVKVSTIYVDQYQLQYSM